MKTTANISNSPGDFEKMYHPSQLIHKAKHELTLLEKNKIVSQKITRNEILIFLVDDDPPFLKALEHSITNKLPYYKINSFQTGEACLQQIKSKPQIVILDYCLNSKLPYAWNGLAILAQIKKLSPKTKVIMLTSQDSLDVAVKCIDNGSFDYISKNETAFVKITNILSNIAEDINMDKSGIKPYQIVIIIIIAILILCALLNH